MIQKSPFLTIRLSSPMRILALPSYTIPICWWGWECAGTFEPGESSVKTIIIPSPLLPVRIVVSTPGACAKRGALPVSIKYDRSCFVMIRLLDIQFIEIYIGFLQNMSRSLFYLALISEDPSQRLDLRNGSIAG